MRTAVDARPFRAEKIRVDYMLCAMLIPGFVYLIILNFSTFGLVIGFQDFHMAKAY